MNFRDCNLARSKISESFTVLLGDSYDSSSRGGEVRGAQGLGGHRHLLPQGHPLPQHQGSEYGTGWSTLYFIGIILPRRT